MSEQDDARAATERARNFLAGLDAVPDDADEVLFDARVEALRTMVPGAGPHAELRLRLVGPNVRDGFYDSEMESALADPLRREFATAAGTKSSPQVELGLVGVSSGSVVLHYRPKIVEVSNDGPQAGVVVPTDTAIRRVLALHNLFEQQADADQIRAATNNNDPFLRGARDVISALTKFDLEMTATWWTTSGAPVRSTLTERGRTYAEGIFSKSEDTKPVHVWGIVSALDVVGVVTVRRPPNSQHQVKIEPDQISEFTLGESVHMLVERKAQVDRVGLSGKPAFSFIRMLEDNEDVAFELDDLGDSTDPD